MPSGRRRVLRAWDRSRLRRSDRRRLYDGSMGASRMTDVTVFYPAAKDLAEWERGHRAGERPDAWPYGLNKLDQHISRLVARSLPRDTLMQRGLRTIMRVTPPAAWRGRGPAGVCWDENSIDRLAAVPALRARFSGVVWLTDQIATKDAAWLGRRRAMLRRMDGLWVLSSAQVAPLRDFLGEGGPEVRHVLFGVDTEFFREAPIPSAPLIVSVGGDRDRDASTLFRAIDEIRRRRPDVEAIIQTTSQAEPPPGVTVVPYLSHAELRELYKRASICLIATRHNTHVSGMTVGLESMATGRPLVITETPGMSDYFGDTDGARMVPSSDAHALASEALTLLDDRQELERRGHAARAHVDGAFTTTHLGHRLAALIGS